MKNRHDPYRLPALPDLIDQSVRSKTQGPQALEAPSEPMTGFRVGFEQRDGVENSFCQPDVELAHLDPSRSSE